MSKQTNKKPAAKSSAVAAYPPPIPKPGTQPPAVPIVKPKPMIA